MYCSSCGVEVSESENFCYRCGASLRAPAPPPVTPVHSQPAPAATQSRPIVLGYAHVAAGVLAALIGGYLRDSANGTGAWWAGICLVRSAIVWLVAGIPLCVVFLWRRGDRRARRHAGAICILLVISLVLVVLLGLGAQEIGSYLNEWREAIRG